MKPHPETDLEVQLLKAVKKDKISTVKKLLSHKDICYLKDARYFDYYLIIKALREYADICIAKLLINKGFRVYKKSKSEDTTVLHCAVQRKDIDLITILLAKGATSDILTPNEQKKTPIHLAIDRNQSSILELFLAQLNVQVFDMKYFLQYVIQEHTIPAVSHLIDNGFILSKSRENTNFKILDILLSYYSVKNMEKNNYNDTALVYNASICGNLQVIKEYAGSGFPLDISLKLCTNSWSCLHNYSGFTLLHFAVKHVKLEVVQFLLNTGAGIFAQNDDGLTPLHLAFENKELGFWETWGKFENNNSIIDLLLEANTKFNSNPVNKYGLSHFHIACSRDEPAIVEHFLKLGVSINQPVKLQCLVYKKFSPLHFASKFRCKKTIELLLKNGADVKQRDYMEMTALHIAARESCPDVVSLLLQYDAGVDVASVDSSGKTPLHWAFENNNYKIMDLLLSVSQVADSNPMDRKGISHFHIACTRNNVDVVKKFIEKGVSIDMHVPIYSSNKIFHYDTVDWSGYSPLHFAVRHNKAKIVQLLLESGANVGIKNYNEYTAHHISCQYTFESFAEVFENILHDSSNHGETTKQPLSITDVVQVDEECINFGGPIEKIDWSSNRSEHLEIINLLFRRGLDVDCTDDGGNTSLFWIYWVINIAVCDIREIIEKKLCCSKSLSLQIAESLCKELYERRKLIINHFLKLNANLDKCSQHGSILHCCAISSSDKDSSEWMEFFIKKGANVKIINDKMWTPLHDAVLHENTDAVRILLNYNAEMNCPDSRDNSTPLLIASRRPSDIRSFEIIKLLADHRANVDAKRTDGKTALHDLARLCTDKEDARFNMAQVFSLDAVVSAMSALIEAGANINSRDSDGFTPLHVACEAANYHFVNVLLELGANVNVEDNYYGSVCCYLYRIYNNSKWLYRFSEHVARMVNILQRYVIKMKEIGLPTSERTLSSVVKCANMVFFSGKRWTEEHEKVLIESCRKEVQVIKDTKIHDDCTLYDMMFMNENTLSRLVKNPAFEAIVKSKLFEKKYSNYSYLVKLKYRTGVQRGNLLPIAKCVLGDLAEMQLPEACSENICKYFKNFELKESIGILGGILNGRMENSGDVKLKVSDISKRQKVN